MVQKKHNHLLLLRERRHRLTEESLKNISPRKGSFFGLKGKSACKNFLKGKCTELSCDLWHPPVCINCKSESGCKYTDYCELRHTEAGGQPSKNSKQLVVYSAGSWKIGIESHRQVLQAHVAPSKNSGKKGSIARDAKM